MVPRFSMVSPVVLALLVASACGEDGPAAAPKSTATADASPSRPAPEGSTARDAGSTTSMDARAPTTGQAPQMADADAPPLTDAGSAPRTSDASVAAATCGSCASDEFCDAHTGQCVDKYQPWQLDCGHLPTGTTCQGGPREVLLVAASGGAVAMFDPVDGHFLGFFSRQDLGAERAFAQATQGPDQCVYLVDTTSDRLQRFAPDGAAKGELALPGAAKPQSITFTEDHLYLASDDQISRLTLDGKLDAELPLPGRQLWVGKDGSWLVRQRDALVHVADTRGNQEARTVLAGLGGRGQVAYAGNGYALVADYVGTSELHYVELETGVDKGQQTGSDGPFGVAQLGNGRRLFTGANRTVGVTPPGEVADSTEAYDEYAIQSTRFSFVGRACLPDAFVRAQAPDPAATDCGAPPGPTLLGENFDDGSLAKWKALDGASSWTVKPGTNPSLSIGAEGTLQRDLGTMRPSFISYRVRILDPGVDSYSPALILRSADGDRVLFVGSGSVAPDGTDWFEVQIRDIDWTHGTFDVYTVVDGKCARAFDDRVLAPATGNLTLVLYEDDLGAAQLDDITVK